MKLSHIPGDTRDLLFRLFPHATRPGLRRIGNPGPESPVLVTGNFTLTVRRLTEVLQGRDAWLLVANSRGINVWCAAGGGHLTQHDIIAAVRASRLAEKVTHRKLVLPQLAATGVERRPIQETTGFRAVWGPARLEDLPAWLDRGQRSVQRDRVMRFPAWEKLEMASMWGVPLSAIAGVVLGLVGGVTLGIATAAAILVSVSTLFLLVPHIPIMGPWRLATHAVLAAVIFALASAPVWLTTAPATGTLVTLGAAAILVSVLLSFDFSGSTPWYPSTINTFHNTFELELVEDRCTGAADCVQVCPRDVLHMDGRRRKVKVVRQDSCIRCGACIVQCPEDALRFRFPDGRVVEPATVRSTRLNLLGRRAVTVRAGAGPASAPATEEQQTGESQQP